MTNPGPPDIQFSSPQPLPPPLPAPMVMPGMPSPVPLPPQSDNPDEAMPSALPPTGQNQRPIEDYPPIMLDVSDQVMEDFKIWLDQWLKDLKSAQQAKQSEWQAMEADYRAVSWDARNNAWSYNYQGTSISTTGKRISGLPFEGASTLVVPVMAMAVDPIHARLDTGIFKQDPVIRVKPIKKSIATYTYALETLIQYYVKHRWNLRQIFSPRMLEFTKLGTMVFKTIYDSVEHPTRKYDPVTLKVVDVMEVIYRGPRILGISLGDFLFPAGYQDIQDTPICFERQRTTIERLRLAEASKKVTNVDDLEGQQKQARTPLELAQEDAANHHTQDTVRRDLVVYEGWGEYNFYPKKFKTPQRFVVTYDEDKRVILRLQLNHYFNQKKQYVIIPYTVVNGSLYGLGICEMVKPFQDAISQWERMASDNAYIANIRMFIAKKDSDIEEVPRLYAGRVFFVDDPSKDFKPFQGGDIYPSTLAERQNLFGLVEKRTGVSDYLTGRESPIIGTRATATSTLALIQEGTKRVEQVLENIRLGVAEIIQNCIDIWIQYGLDDVEDLIFGDDEIGRQLKVLFDTVLTTANVRGAIAIDLAATDASGNRQVQQQLQLSIIQLMMGYYEKLIQAGGMAMQAMAQGATPLSDLIVATSDAAKQMFLDLLQKYEVPNAEDYLPDLADYMKGIKPGGAANVPVGAGQGGSGNPQGPAGGPGGPGTVPSVAQAPTGVRGPSAPGTGSGNGVGSAVRASLAGASGGV